MHGTGEGGRNLQTHRARRVGRTHKSRDPGTQGICPLAHRPGDVISIHHQDTKAQRSAFLVSLWWISFEPGGLDFLEEFSCGFRDCLHIARLRRAGECASNGNADSSGLDPIGHIVEIYAAGRKKVGLRQGPADSADRARAEQFSRKELDDVGAALHGAEHFLDGHRSGDTRYLVTVAEPHRRLVQRRSHDVLRAGQHRHPGSRLWARGFPGWPPQNPPSLYGAPHSQWPWDLRTHWIHPWWAEEGSRIRPSAPRS